MSNILIIKHGSLGDIVQISGVLRDIRESNQDKKIFILTTLPYVDLLSRCPYINGVLIDKRRPRWNILYLYKLKKMVEKFNFTMVFDLQNSPRTSFYKKYLFQIPLWNSTETTLKKGEKKKDFDNSPVLKRFKLQLDSVKVKTNYTLQPDFSWAITDIDQIVNKYFGKKFILIFPFSSPELSHKQWPHYNNLINIIKSKHNTEVVIAPSNNEVQQGKNINAISILNNGKALNIMQVAGLIKKSTFVIANDTGPAHMSAHLGAEGVTLFGYHTTPEKVSIETDKFKAIKSNNLEKLSADDVYKEIKPKLELLFNKA